MLGWREMSQSLKSGEKNGPARFNLKKYKQINMKKTILFWHF